MATYYLAAGEKCIAVSARSAGEAALNAEGRRLQAQAEDAPTGKRLARVIARAFEDESWLQSIERR